jgi:excisionase family DNA binding protein
MNIQHEQVYFTKSEAAQYLRCSLRFIDYARERDELKAFRLNRKLLFARNDLDAFVRKRAVNVNLDRVIDEVVAEVMSGHSK